MIASLRIQILPYRLIQKFLNLVSVCHAPNVAEHLKICLMSEWHRNERLSVGGGLILKDIG